MSRPLVEGFLFDEINEIKISLHGLSVRQVIHVLENRHVMIPNRKHRRGLYLIIGKDNGGNCIAIPVERTNDLRVWRPITAWFCKDSEQTLLEKKER
jgi:uncharacterized DUF497 family protein